MASVRVLVTLLSCVLGVGFGACASGEGGSPDGAVVGTPDTGTPLPDASKVEPDAPLSQPDATPLPDASMIVADAFIPVSDAGPGFPDAGSGNVCTMAGTLPDNDTCAQVIDLTPGVTAPGGVTTWGDTTGYVDDSIPPTSCATYTHDGPEAMYRVDAVAGTTISVTLTPDAGFDISVYILSTCTDANTCVLGSDAALSGGVETLSYPVPTTSTYYVVVDSWDAAAFGCYTLNVAVQ